MVKDYKAKGNNVLLVDAGDAIQGTAYSYFDKRKSIIKLINKTGYNLATPGNHEFDFYCNFHVLRGCEIVSGGTGRCADISRFYVLD